MTVERIEPRHLPAVAALERAVFANPWSERALALLTGEDAVGFAAVENGRVCAYGGMLIAVDEGQITNIATAPDCRRRGFAAAVLAALLAAARARGLVRVTLEVRESNAPAIALYRKHGFAAVGRRPHFYTHPAEAALVMCAEL